LLQVKDHEFKGTVDELQQEINRLDNLLQHQEEDHAAELQEMEERVQGLVEERTKKREMIHKEEVTALTREWDLERKVRSVGNEDGLTGFMDFKFEGLH
jgi:predicted nuclease with TOPRIM domain